MHVDLIFADHPLENPHVPAVADLQEQVTTSEFDVTFQDMITVLCHPDDVCRQTCDRMPAESVMFHGHDFYHVVEVCSN